MAESIQLDVVFNAFNRTGAAFDQVNQNLSKVSKQAEGMAAQLGNSALTQSPVLFMSLNDAMGRLRGTFDGVVGAGSSFQKQMAELSAITGVTGEQLDFIGQKARENAKAFGGDASRSVEVYKLLLSQLGPEIAQTPKVLARMADNVSVLSKTMGGDVVGAAGVLTTSMNQYGVSLKDPIEAQRQMAEMMNIMAAAAKEGSAELPQQKEAVAAVGGVAQAAGLKFAEMAAAIQVLDKAGKKSAEGGVALRNVIATLGQGRFLPKDAAGELQAAGVDLEALGDKTIPFTDRLRMLNPVLEDSALLAKVFGRENVLAGQTLIQQAAEQDRLTQAISGTQSASEQAAVISNTFAEKMSRLHAWMEDVKIAVFDLHSGWLGYAAAFGDVISGVSNGAQAISSLSSIFRIHRVATLASAAAQGVLNFIMSINPIALVVAAIAALIGLIYRAITHFEQWGAAFMLLLGPFGLLISFIRTLHQGWDMVRQAFRDGGILGALKAIGSLLLVAVLKPIQQLLELAAKLPVVGDFFQKGADRIKGYIGQFASAGEAEQKPGGSKAAQPSSAPALPAPPRR